MQKLKTDILIVGAGLTGLMTAYALSELKTNIIIIDKFNFVSEKNNNFAIMAPYIQVEKDKLNKNYLKNISPIEVENVRGFAMFLNLSEFKEDVFTGVDLVHSQGIFIGLSPFTKEYEIVKLINIFDDYLTKYK